MHPARHSLTAVIAATLLTVAASAVRAPAVNAGIRSNANVTAPTTSDSSDVAATVSAFHRALQEGDSVAALALLAPDVIIQESGGVETRSEYAGHHLAGDMRFAKALPGVRSAQRIVVVGDVAWSTSSSTTKGTYRERQINSLGAEMMILAKVGGTWQIRAIHWSSRTPRS